MYRNFYKPLIVGNSQSTIFFIPNRNDGIMECWNDGMIACHAFICQYYHRKTKATFSHAPNL